MTRKLMSVHAEKLTEAGFSVFMVDPFTGRNIQNTMSEQLKFSFAASTWDVFAAMKTVWMWFSPAPVTPIT